MSLIPKILPLNPQKVIPEFVGSFVLSFSCRALQLITTGSIQFILSTELIALINTKKIDPINPVNWHFRPQQPNCTTVVLLFWFSWMIKSSIIVVLHTVSYCWYTHLFFIFCFCLPLNPTVVYTEEVILLSQRWILYCCVSCDQMFLPGFLLPTEPSYCVPGAINWNIEDLEIVSSIAQYDDLSKQWFSPFDLVLRWDW